MTAFKKIWKLAVLSVAIVFLAIQLLPVPRLDAKSTGDLSAPEEVKAILRTSCYDCHSNETQIPWYGHVAPVSWLVVRDVKEGREHLNFSNWATMSPGDQAETAEESIEEITRLKMPLPIYLPMHPDARVTDTELQILRTWASTVGGASHGGEARDGEKRGERRGGREREEDEDEHEHEERR